jgi:hypothetical protein
MLLGTGFLRDQIGQPAILAVEMAVVAHRLNMLPSNSGIIFHRRVAHKAPLVYLGRFDRLRPNQLNLGGRTISSKTFMPAS